MTELKLSAQHLFLAMLMTGKFTSYVIDMACGFPVAKLAIELGRFEAV